MHWTSDPIVQTPGQVRSVAVGGSGWSRRRLVERFREEVGLPPKMFARVLRFHPRRRNAGSGDARRLSDVALDCGYYDRHTSTAISASSRRDTHELVRPCGPTAASPPTVIRPRPAPPPPVTLRA